METKVLRSRITGQLTTYYPTVSLHITTPAPAPPDMTAMRKRVNDELYANSIDGFCDDIFYLGGVFEDQFKASVWVAEEQPALGGTYGSPIGILFVIALVLLCILAAIIVYGVVKLAEIAAYIIRGPAQGYVGGTPDNPVHFDNMSEYITYQHTMFWYVCPKCGAGFGEKLLYPTIEDVPASLKQAYDEHVATCLGIPQPEILPMGTIMVAVAIVAVSVVAVIVLPPLIRGIQEATRAPAE